MADLTVEFKVHVRWWFKYVVGACIVLKREPPEWIYRHGLKIVQVKQKNKSKDHAHNA